MRWSLAGAAFLAISFPSYAQSAGPEAFLGAPAAAPAGAKAASAPGRPLGPGRPAISAARYSSVLDGLRPESRAATRGANEMRVYQAASPSVVLVVSQDSLGSGVLVSADGKIVTNLHVVGESGEVGVVFKPAAEGAQIGEADVRVAKVLRRDQVADLALIQVAEVPKTATPLAIGGAASLSVGADVHAIGHPTGQSWTYTRGVVSQIRPDYAWTNREEKVEHKATVIQTQTPVNPGNSGGPLIDDNLHVVGINSFKSAGEGLNFAVSGEDVKAFLARAEDRMAQPPEKTAEKDCEATVLKDWRSEDGKGDEFLIDGDCDGEGDWVSVIPDKKKEPALLVWDDNGDGKIDSVLVDENRDGHPEYGLFDTDGDEKSDLMGYYRKGEDEPYRYDRIKN